MPILLFCRMQFSIHKKFQLNKTSFDNTKDLLEFAENSSSLIFSFLSDFLSDSEFITVQTSGSTGKPKPIEIKKEFMINSALATGEFFDLKENTSALLCMNPSFIAGKMMLVRAMVLGWQLDVVSPRSNPLERLKKQYDFCAMVPMQVYYSFDDLDKIKKLLIGGGVIPKAFESKLQTIKTKVFASFGMTETITHIAVKRVNGESEKSYTVLSNVNISKDSRGCLVINAPKVSNNTIITNDLVKLISDTNFQWLGRFDNIINSGGIKLIPEQIEGKLAEIISDRFFVAGIKDAVLGEKLILIVEAKQNSKLKIQDLKLKTLSKYETPKEIYFVEKFVETDTKKIQRKKTLDLLF